MLRMRARVDTPFLIALGLAAPLLAAQAAPASAPPPKSVRGKLESVDQRAGGVIMTGDDGKRLAWRLNAAVIAEAAKVPAGAPMIVIYRQTASNEKRVTAVAFPGTAATPTYVNLTGASVVLRSAAAVGGVCGAADAGPVTESVIPPGGRAEVLEGCWCCAPFGGTCTAGTKSGTGNAFLERCFE